MVACANVSFSRWMGALAGWRNEMRVNSTY